MRGKERVGERMRLTAFKAPPRLLDWLRAIASRDGRSQGDIIRAALERELAYREHRMAPLDRSGGVAWPARRPSRRWIGWSASIKRAAFPKHK